MVCSANLHTIKTCLLWYKNCCWDVSCLEVCNGERKTWLKSRKKVMWQRDDLSSRKIIISRELFSHTGWWGHEQHRSFRNTVKWGDGDGKKKAALLVNHVCTFKLPLWLWLIHTVHIQSATESVFPPYLEYLTVHSVRLNPAGIINLTQTSSSPPPKKNPFKLLRSEACVCVCVHMHAWIRDLLSPWNNLKTNDPIPISCTTIRLADR